MTILKIKNWSSYQSYKDRKPPWIRLHKSLLDNYEYLTMSLTGRATLPLLWLLASEDENPVTGTIRIGYEKISFRLRLPMEEIMSGISECIKSGFIEEKQEVTESLQKIIQTVTPETEKRHIEQTETETEAERARFENKGVKNGKITGETEGRRIAEKILSGSYAMEG